MGRPNKDEYYLNIAEAVMQRSTCLRRKYGAVIVKDDEIISTGYNGAPRGEPNCNETGHCWRKENNIPHGERYEACISGNTIIKLLDGTYKTILELAEEGGEHWVYSVHEETGSIIPGLARLARKTKTVDSFLRVHFDDGGFVDCTEDHRFMMRDCSYKEAEKLSIGDSVMPMNFKFENANHEYIHNTPIMRNESRWVLNSVKCSTRQKGTHRIVFEALNGEIPAGYVVHHRDFNPHNNTPENLMLLSASEHIRIHGIHRFKEGDGFTTEDRIKGVEMQKRRLAEDEKFRAMKQYVGRMNMNANWQNEEWVKATVETRRLNGALIAAKTNSDPRCIKARQRGVVAKGISDLMFRMKQNGDVRKLIEATYEFIRKDYILRGRSAKHTPMLKTILKWYGNFNDAIEAGQNYNHKVMYIEKINKRIDVYDITVEGMPNFAVLTSEGNCVVLHNCHSVHAEMNAIISASRRDMIGSTLYLASDQPNAKPCDICRRLILNAGIGKVITREMVNHS